MASARFLTNRARSLPGQLDSTRAIVRLGIHSIGHRRDQIGGRRREETETNRVLFDEEWFYDTWDSPVLETVTVVQPLEMACTRQAPFLFVPFD